MYQKLEEQGIDGKDIPTILLNIATRKNDFEIEENDTLETIKTKRLEQYDKIIAENIEFLKQEKSNGIISNLKQDLSIERIERFLGYYDIKGTGIQLRPYQQTADEKTDEILKDNRFASVILPTGGGKSFVTISQLLKHQKEEILYLAPQNEILEQMKDYIIKYVHGPVNTIGRSKDEIIADVFPNLKFSTYSGLLARNGKEIINKEYGFVVLDELHRTGAKEWGDRLNTLIDNQPETTKVLGITATPRRDADGINMANEMAERLGYTNKEAVSGKHIAMNMSLTNAIRMGLVVNPKLVSCAYSLKEDGSLDKLKDKIEQIEDIEEKNEKLAQYETLRRNIENAEGIPEILQANVKKGGKYIVFLPIVDELEDEDGNVIGRKKGKDKLADYEKQIAEYFKGSDIIPNFHSMLGEYGDKENAKRLEEFQNSNTEETEFMLVMNKANEGLHLDKLDGIIWLRPLDENSRILYLQQLGRVIYSEDPDNPTKDEDRPVVIDLVNNTIKVNWEDEITEQDDIQMLNLITNWAEAHNGILPNINSTDKEETGYAKILKEIQDKYKGYLENEFDGLNEKQIEEVREIIKLGTRIDLWQIELPEKIQQTRSDETNERSLTDRKIGSFEVTGLLKNFIELEKEIDESNNKSAIQKFIETLEKLKEIEVDVSKMVQKDTIGSLAKKSGINEEKIIKIGLNPEDSIGKSKTNIAANYRKDRDYVEKEQLKRLTELGIFLELRNPTQELIEILERMQKVGIEVSNITSKDTIGSLAKKSGISEEKIKEIGLSPRRNIGTRKNYIAIRYRKNSSYLDEEQLKRLDKLGIRLEKKKGPTQELIETLEKMKKTGIDVSKMVERDTIGSLAKKSGISKEKITEIGLNSKERIGVSKNSIAVKYRKNVKYITEEQLKKLEKLGINLEVQQRNIPQEFIETLEKMQEIGVDVSKMIQRDTIRSLAEKSGISEEKIKEIGLNPKENIGRKKHNISLKYKKDKKYVEKEQIKKLKSLGINLDKKTRTSKEIAEASISSLTDIEMSDREDVALKELVENTKEGGINLDEQS